MRRFLYITPYFPPHTKVGALRPLKFARHLPDLGWQPVVLADMMRGDKLDPAIERHVPASIEVIWDFSPRARGAAEAYANGEHGPKPMPTWRKRLPTFLRNEFNSPTFFWPDPEVLPLGRHSVDMPRALKAGREVLRRGGIEAIMVNADPYAGMLVAQRLGEEFGLPVIHDLRDPWSVCELRRPKRPRPQRWLVDRMERWCVEHGAKVILNTRTAYEDYLEHYSDVPEDRFTYIRNHGDASLISGGEYAPREVFTALFLGNFRRFHEGTEFIEALAILKDRGVGPDQLEFLVTGQLPTSARNYARKLGVDTMLIDHPFVPYVETRTFMQTADLLIAVSNSRQRSPAKVYEYAMSTRPMLIVADSPELRDLFAPDAGTAFAPKGDAVAIADRIAEAMANGRQVDIERSGLGLDSRTASERLAAILDEITG